MKSKKLRKMRAFIVKCCGRQTCHDYSKQKTTTSKMSTIIYRNFVKIETLSMQNSTSNHRPAIEELSQPIETTSISFPCLFFNPILVFIASQLEQSEIVQTTLLSADVTQDLQTQSDSDLVEANATYTLSLEGSHLCFKNRRRSI
jgi:hypothetical protein